MTGLTNTQKLIDHVANGLSALTGQPKAEIVAILDYRVDLQKRQGVSFAHELKLLSGGNEEAKTLWEKIRGGSLGALGEQGAIELRFQKNYMEPRLKALEFKELEKTLEQPSEEALVEAQKAFEQSLDLRAKLAPLPLLVTPGVAALARLVPGELHLWGAETKHGKTTNCAGIHEPLVNQGLKTAHITIEEAEDTFRLRVACLTEGIDVTHVGAGKLPQDAVDRIKVRVAQQRPFLRVIAGPSFGRPDIFAQALESFKDGGYTIITFDYISKAITSNSEGQNRAEQEKIMIACEKFVKCGIPMVVFGQLRKFDPKVKSEGVGERFRGNRSLHLLADNTIEMRAYKKAGVTRWKRCNTRWEDNRLSICWTQLVNGRHQDIPETEANQRIADMVQRKADEEAGNLSDLSKSLNDD